MRFALAFKVAERHAAFTQKAADVIACVTFSGLTGASCGPKQRPPWRRSMSAERHKTGAAGASTRRYSGLACALSRRARPASALRRQGAVCRGRRATSPAISTIPGPIPDLRASPSAKRPRLSSSAAASAACCVARVCARPASLISASWKRLPISAAPGTGIAIPVRPATPRATSICRCWKRPATCRCANMRVRRRSTNTRAASAVTSVSTSARCFRPSSRAWRGRSRRDAGWSRPIAAIASARAS